MTDDEKLVELIWAVYHSPGPNTLDGVPYGPPVQDGDGWFAEYVLAADHTRLAEALDVATEALEKINEVGTVEMTVRIGDMYSEDGWNIFTNISDEAEIARAALDRIGALYPVPRDEPHDASGSDAPDEPDAPV